MYGVFPFFFAYFCFNSSEIGPKTDPEVYNFMNMYILFMNINVILMNINEAVGKKLKCEYFYFIWACLFNQCRLCYKLMQRSCMLHAYQTSSAKTCLMEGYISNALTRLYLSHLQQHFCPFLCGVNNQYYHKHVKTADRGWHKLFLHKAGFLRLHHI